MQDDPNIDVREEPFLFAQTQLQGLGDLDNAPVPDTYMADILALFSSLPEASESNKLLVSKKQRFGVLTGMSKELAERASSSQELFQKLKGVLEEQLADLRGEDEIKDPIEVKGKGRPRKSRLVSSVESKKGRSSVRCGRCGEEGHNSRSCEVRRAQR